MTPVPLVSVVIPCYRQARFLPAALGSVFAQTHPAVEAVVVNDGSDDDTDAVARRFLPRVRYVAQANAGLPAARNAGVRAAAGEYLLFLDADDLLAPAAVERLVAAAGPADRLVIGGFEWFTETPNEPGARSGAPAAGPPFPRLIHANIAPVHAHLCPRPLFDRLGGFEPGLRACEDWDLWLRAGLAGAALVIVPEVVAYYRTTPGSMSTDSIRMVVARAEVLVRAAAGFLATPDLLAAHGAELAAAAHRVRRRLWARGLRSDLAAALSAALSQLTGHGFPPPGRAEGGRPRPDRWAGPGRPLAHDLLPVVRPAGVRLLPARVRLTAMKITVAICTWNRAALLDQTLTRMRDLVIPPGVTWELLVVDNNSTDNTDAVLAKHAGGPLPLRRLFEPKQGHSNARNCAVERAAGSLLVWTDDDVLVGPNWLAEYVAAADAWPDAAYFGGQIIPWYEVPPPTWALRHRDQIGYCWAVLERDRAVRQLAESEYVVGANMAYRTAVLRGYSFDPTLGRVGSALISGEETCVQDQLRRDGHTGVWVGTAEVRHFVPASRLRLDYIWRFHYEGFRASARKTNWSQAGSRLFGVPRWMLRRYIASTCIELVLRPFKTRWWMEAFIDRAKFKAYLAEARLTTCQTSVDDSSTSVIR